MKLRVPGLDAALDALDRRLRGRAKAMVDAALLDRRAGPGGPDAIRRHEKAEIIAETLNEIADAIRDVRP